MSRNTYIEINTANLKSNVETLIGQYPVYKYYFGVVKGNAYGHGFASVKALIDGGVNYLAVSFVEEAIAIRNEGIDTPILLLQPIHLEDIETAIKNNITITVSNYEYFKKLIALPISKQLKIHLKINSGFNRLGISNKQFVTEIFETLQSTPHFKLEGIYSHLATSGRYDTYFDTQIKRFKEITSGIDLTKISIIHVGRSLTLLTHEKVACCNGVRVGVAMFGYGVSQQQSGGIKALIKKMFNLNSKLKKIHTPELSPVFGLYSEVIEVNKVKKGDYVGYGAAFKAETDCFVACVSFGYADGFFKKNKGGCVAVNGKQYQIISVDMGITTVLVDENVRAYDKVEFIGETISAKEVATRCDTTVYEILSEFKESLPRVFVK